jgi:hypothetical protein
MLHIPAPDSGAFLSSPINSRAQKQWLDPKISGFLELGILLVLLVNIRSQ